MERTFLESFGLEKNQIDSILNEHSKDIGKKVNEINSLNAQLEKLQNEVSTANSTITSLKNSNRDNEDLQKKIDEYKNKMTQMQTEFDLERKNTAILNELQKNDFIDPDLVVNLIDTDKVIKAKDGTYSGLTEQIEAIINNTKYDYLRNIKGEETEEIVIPEIDRGGYDPNSAGQPNIPETNQTATEKKLIGEIVGAEAEERVRNNIESAENFWNSVKI